MSLQEEITKAIGAHGMWKNRLHSAIETGKSEFTVDHVSHDNNCDFGRWLYGSSIPPTSKLKPDYDACRRLHADFHREAAGVLKLALSGQKDKALSAMDRNGKFAEVSANLTTAMMKWQKADKA